MTLRGWALSGVLVACAAHAEERGFQFRAVADVGAALRLGASANSTVYAGPMVAFDATVGGRIGVVAFHGGAELQGVWLIGAAFPATLRVGPVTGLSVYAARWAVLSLDAKLLFPAVGRDFVALGGAFRWGFQLTADGAHLLAASVSAYFAFGALVTGSVSYVFTLQP